jgi:hypothetical protein
MATLERISRYPVKGLSAENLSEIEMTSGRGVASDRTFALALADTEFDDENPRPIPKAKFAVLARIARLAELTTVFDVPTSTLSLRLSDYPRGGMPGDGKRPNGGGSGNRPIHGRRAQWPAESRQRQWPPLYRR